MTLTRRLGPRAMRSEPGPSSLTQAIGARGPSAAHPRVAVDEPIGVLEAFERKRMFGAALLAGWGGWSLLALWLSVRPRSWPADSTADLGGLLLWLIAGALPLASLGRRRSWRLSIAALPVTALLLLGHVGPILAVFAIALSGPAVVASLLLSRGVVSSSIDSPQSTRRPSALPNPGEPVTLSVRSDSAPFLDSAGTTVTSDEEVAEAGEAEEIGAEDLDEGDEACDEEGVDDEHAGCESLQRWTRFREAGAERIVGSAIVDLAPGEQTAWLHFPCWPPLPSPPLLTLTSDDPSATLKGAQRERHGFRIEVRLPRPTTFERRLTVEFVALAEASG